MADKIKIRRGDFVDLPNLDEAEFGLATDTGTLYIGTESATNILINPVLEHGDGYSVDGYLLPAVDNVHNLGTPENRWHSLYVGPGTLNIIAKDTDAGYTANQEFRIGVDAVSGTLQFISGSNDLLMILDPETGVSFPSGGSVEADPGLVNTVTEHYNQQEQINKSILKELDGYGTSVQAPDLGATGDGYLAFYTGVGRNIAGDNDLFWDRANNKLTIGGHFSVDATTGYLGINSSGAPNNYQALFIEEGNVWLQSTNEQTFTMKTVTDSMPGGRLGDPVLGPKNPVWNFGRVIASPPLYKAEWRLLYSDDDTTERAVFSMESTGTFAGIRTSNGSYFEGFISGESEPQYRINSFPDTTFEAGPGGSTTTDVGLRRMSAGNWSMVNPTTDGYASLTLDSIIAFGNMSISGNIVNIAMQQALDSYASVVTESEHYTQQSQINQSILQSLDGYAVVPNTAAVGDGYIAFFIDAGRQLAGDNDFYWDRLNGRLILGGTDSATSPTLGFGDGNTGFYEQSNDTLRIAIAGAAVWRIDSTIFGNGIAGRSGLLNSSATSTVPNVVPNISDQDTGIGQSATGQLSFISDSVEIMRTTAATTFVYNDLSVGGSIVNKDLTEAFQVIRQAADGYASVPNTASISDGYVAFFIDGGRQLAGDNDLFWDRVNNRFGIGTVGDGVTLPAAKLEVADNNPTSGLILKVTQSDHNTYGIIIGNDTFSTTDTDGMAMYVDNSGVSVVELRGTGARYSVQVGGGEAIRILNNRNIGFGTATPQNKLDVEGAMVVGATYSGTNTAPTNGMLVEGNIGIGITSVGATQVDVTQSTASTTVSGVDISNDSTGDAFIRFGLGATRGYSLGIDNSDSDTLKLGTNSDTGSGVDTNTIYTITAAGLIGIATAPATKLTVNDAGTTSGISLRHDNDNASNAEKGGVLNLIAGEDDGRGSRISATYFGGVGSKSNLILETFNNNDQIMLHHLGNVGIGTASPHEKLTVTGVIALQELDAFARQQDGYGYVYVKSDDTLHYKNGPGVDQIVLTSALPFNAAGADGYLAFYTDTATLAGDNDLFYDRINSTLTIAGGTSDVRVGDANFRLDFDAGGEDVPGIVFDTGNDRMRYSRSANSFQFDVGGTTSFSISGANVSSSKNLIPGADDTYDLGIGGSTQWRHGYFTGGLIVGFSAGAIADEIQLGDATFKLDFDSGGAGVPGLLFDTGDSITYNRTSNFYSFNVASSEKMRLTTDGYVGIGGTPNDLFEVRGFNQTEGHVRVSIGETNLYTSGIEFYTATTERRGFVGWRGTESGSSLDNAGVYLVNFDNSPLYLGTNGVERMQITGVDGYVGINGTPQLVGGVGPGRLQVFTSNAGESMIVARDTINAVGLEIVSNASANIMIRGGGGDNLHLSSNSSSTPAITVDATNIVQLPGFVAYASVTILTDTTANDNTVNPFRDAYHAAFVENTNWRHNVQPANITYGTTTGQFTVGITGVYAIEVMAYITSASTGIMDSLAIRLNGATNIWQAQPTVHSSVDPASMSIVLYQYMDATNYVELTMDGALATTVIAENGTTFNIRRIA